MRKNLLLSLTLVVLACFASSAAAAGWGNLKGKFVLDGKAPAANKIMVTKDPAVCAKPGAAPLLEENLVVGKDGGINNVVVTLFLTAGAKKPEIHPDYAAALKKPVVVDNKACRFEPRIVLARVGQAVEFTNSDAVGHNVNFTPLKNTPFNDTIPPNASVKKEFKLAEIVPATVSCGIHPWMKGMVVLREDPYMAVTGADGSFEIKNVPAGKWTFRAWQETSGYVAEVKLKDKATKWPTGKFEVEIADGKDFDLGEVKVPLKLFEAKK